MVITWSCGLSKPNFDGRYLCAIASSESGLCCSVHWGRCASAGVAKGIYHADAVLADQKIRDQLKLWEKQGYGHLPVCMAKTQYSFSTDPSLRGAPTGHSIPVREVRLSAGAGFIVVVCGEIMTMPGLPRVPSAEAIHLNENGQIEGLF